jgi:PNKP adenylyltransferase domain, ligase domain
MVVKPQGAVVRGRRGLVQPRLKVRGREYLRLIYGPEYTSPEHLERLRERNLAHMRSIGGARVRARDRGAGEVRSRRAPLPGA